MSTKSTPSIAIAVCALLSLPALIACGSSEPQPAAPQVAPTPTTEGNATPTAGGEKPSGPTACTAEESGDSFGAMSNERIAGVGLGADAKTVAKTLGAPETKSGPVNNEVEGGQTWTWRYEKDDLTISFNGEVEADMKAATIQVGPRASAATRFGIKVGSPVADVETAYGPCKSTDDSTGELLVAGSVYGGVIFTIEGGVVKDIFVGAAAE